MIVDNNKQSSSNDTSASSRSSNGSFKRKESVSLSTTSTTEKLSPGVKSWSVGSSLGLVSSGHAQLDKLIVAVEYFKEFGNFGVQQEIVSAARIEWIYIDAITAEYSPSNVKNSTKLEFTLGRIYDLVSTVLDSSSSNNTVVHRVFIPCLYEILTVSEILPHEMVIQSRVVAQFALRMKHRIRSGNAFLHLCISSSVLLSCPTLSTQLCHISDTVLAVQSFAGRAHTIPHEFAEFSGFLMVLKTQDSGMFAAFRPSSSRFGLKRDRRKLHIEPLHLPPEQNRAFAGVGGFDPLPTPPTSSSSTSSSTVSESGAHSHGVEIHYHHPRGLQPDLTKNNSAVLSEDTKNINGSNSIGSISSNSVLSSQSKLSSSLAAIKAARESAAVDTLTAPTLLTLPAPISIAATRPKENQRINSGSSKKIEF
eukprot:gene26952-35651_t